MSGVTTAMGLIAGVAAFVCLLFRPQRSLLSRLFDWRGALTLVTPRTFIGWHRQAFRLLWRAKSQPGRPPIPRELHDLIRQIVKANPSWGQERIANELLLKLGICVSPRTVRKYISARPHGRPHGDQRWSTFLRNHADAIVACDFCVVVTANFHLLYVFILMEHASRQVAAARGARLGHPTRRTAPA